MDVNIIRPAPAGHVLVTFWTSDEDPEGCMVALRGGFIYAVAAVETAAGQPREVGLLELHDPLFQHLRQIHQEKSIVVHDYAIIGNGRELVVVAQQGGVQQLPPEASEQLAALRVKINDEDIEQQVRKALRSF